MAFTEIKPQKAQGAVGTGVRMTLSHARGLSITVAADALAALGGAVDEVRFRVLVDMSIGVRQIRIVADRDGPYTWRQPRAAGSPYRTIRVGRNALFGADEFKALDCTWEAADIDAPAIDVDLPREMRAAAATETQTRMVAPPSTSSSGVRTTSVTLPKVGNGGAR